MSVGLVQRAMNVLTKPATEWDVIAGETATTQGLFVGYACILALIPFFGSLLGRVIIGGLFGGGIGLVGALIGGLLTGAVTYALTLGVVFAVALIINVLAPSFDAKTDTVQALKVSIYSSTPVWVAGVLAWIPILNFLVYIAAVAYGCYLLYLGIQKVVKPPTEKAIGLTIVVILVEVVLFGIAFWIAFLVSLMAAFGAAASTVAATGGG
jgi:hypothetical protein